MTITEGSPALVCVQSWAGRSEIPCIVVRLTPKQAWVRFDRAGVLPRYRLVLAGEEVRVPKTALKEAP